MSEISQGYLPVIAAGPEREHTEVPLERDLKRLGRALFPQPPVDVTPSKHDPLLVKQLGAEADDPVAAGELLLVTDEARYEHRISNQSTKELTKREVRLRAKRIANTAIVSSLGVMYVGFEIMPTQDEYDGNIVKQISQTTLALSVAFIGATISAVAFNVSNAASSGRSWRRFNHRHFSQKVVE